MSEMLTKHPALKHIPSAVRNTYHEMFLTGSRVICDPPVLDTDTDLVVLIEETMQADVVALLGEEGFTFIREYADRPGLSLKKETPDGVLNIILTGDNATYERWRAATALATKLKLNRKEDRIELFSVVMNYAVVGALTYVRNSDLPSPAANVSTEEMVTTGTAAVGGRPERFLYRPRDVSVSVVSRSSDEALRVRLPEPVPSPAPPTGRYSYGQAGGIYTRGRGSTRPTAETVDRYLPYAEPTISPRADAESSRPTAVPSLAEVADAARASWTSPYEDPFNS